MLLHHLIPDEEWVPPGLTDEFTRITHRGLLLCSGLVNRLLLVVIYLFEHGFKVVFRKGCHCRATDLLHELASQGLVEVVG